MIDLDPPFIYSQATCMFEGDQNRFIQVNGHTVASKIGSDPWHFPYPKSLNIEIVKAQAEKVDRWIEERKNHREEELKARDAQNIAVIDAAITRGKK